VSDGDPIAYTALVKGTPVLTSTGVEFASVEHVLQLPELDLFDGIVIETSAGIRFVDADQVDRITTAAVHCRLTDTEAAQLPEPDGDGVYTADATEDQGNSLTNRFGRLFGRSHWKREHE
jgi:hypothetical protein